MYTVPDIKERRNDCRTKEQQQPVEGKVVESVVVAAAKALAKTARLHRCRSSACAHATAVSLGMQGSDPDLLDGW